MMTHNRVWLVLILVGWVAVFIAAGIAHETNQESWFTAMEALR